MATLPKTDPSAFVFGDFEDGVTGAGIKGGVPLSITHIATNKSVTFTTFKLRSFSDKLSTNYSSEDVFGRMDPIMTYQGTGRNISMGFDIGSGGAQFMSKALAMVSRLMQFQYPVYENAANALSLSRPPLVKVKFGNYIRSGTGGSLLCAMKGMSYSPFDKYDLAYTPHLQANDEGETHIIPKRVSVDLELVVLHEETPAWAEIDKEGINWIGGDQWVKVDFGSKYGSSKSAGQGVVAGFSDQDVSKANLAGEVPDAEAEKIKNQWENPGGQGNPGEVDHTSAWKT